MKSWCRFRWVWIGTCMNLIAEDSTGRLIAHTNLGIVFQAAALDFFSLIF